MPFAVLRSTNLRITTIQADAPSQANAIHINFFRILLQCLLPSVAVASVAAVGTAGASTAAVLALQYYLHPSQPIHLAQIFQFVKLRLEPRPYAV